jgi:purine nucleosidase
MQQVWIDTDMGFDDLAAVLLVAAQPDWQIDGPFTPGETGPWPVRW